MNWTNGYPAETNYRLGFYRNLAPLHLAMICHLQGVQSPSGELTYLELGCGAGLSTMLLAAANPKMTFIGVDFGPSHIVEAQSAAQAANLRNVTFIEASFDDDALLDALPPCDIISLHGVYTWVAPRQREAIRRILFERLNPGGLFYIAYNNMVRSSHEIVLQRALRELSRAGTADSLKSAVDKIKQMNQLGAEYFKYNPLLSGILEDAASKDASYLIHEYLTDHWSPYFFQDLARELGDCKLQYLGSAAPADNREEFAVSPELGKLIRMEDDPHVRQFLTDISSNRRFRNDIFVRGFRSLDSDERIKLLRTTPFALARPRSDIEMQVTIGRGVLRLQRPIYSMVLDHLQDQPQTLEALALDDDSLVDVITLMSQAAIIHPAAEAPVEPVAAWRLNDLLFSTEARRHRYEYAAAPRIGSAVPIAGPERIQIANALKHPTGHAASSQAGIAFWRTLQIIN